MKDRIIKIWLVGLAVLSVFIACFSNAWLVAWNSTTLNQTFNWYTYQWNWDMSCLVLNSCSSYPNDAFFFIVNSSDSNVAHILNFIGAWSINSLSKWLWYCTETSYFWISSTVQCNITITDYTFSNYSKSECKSTYDLIEPSECSVMSSLECQTEYNLIPISSVDETYCTTNNLCPSCSTCPIVGSWVSSLYINDILHVWSPLIYLNIPQEIGWDYEYTQGWTNMIIDVEGYNVDYDKIQWIIDVQNYKPSSDDFSNIVSWFGNFWGLLVATLFVILVFYFIKKMFK